MAVTVDVAVLSRQEDELMVVVVRRSNEPHRGSWVLPGGFVELEEDLPAAAARELAEETGIHVDPSSLRQLGAFGAPGRDPRMRVVTVAFWTEIEDPGGLRAGSDAADCRLVSVADLLAEPETLGFDHAQIIADALSAAGSTPEP
jgi:8-oxo-dGTP diphosphatase